VGTTGVKTHVTIIVSIRKIALHLFERAGASQMTTRRLKPYSFEANCVGFPRFIEKRHDVVGVIKRVPLSVEGSPHIKRW
jgi:hypothetical protein